MGKKDKLVCGVGANDVDYVVKTQESYYVNGKRRRRTTWECPYYRKWKDMLSRCGNHKNYKDVFVCEEWYSLKNFILWCKVEEQLRGFPIEVCELDKDILQYNCTSKCYSSETCLLVHSKVNHFLSGCFKNNADKLTGAYWSSANSKWLSQTKDPISGKTLYLGYYLEEREAHRVWRDKKISLINSLNNSGFIKDSFTLQALFNYFRYQEEK